jgi:hypothetical protein
MNRYSVGPPEVHSGHFVLQKFSPNFQLLPAHFSEVLAVCGDDGDLQCKYCTSQRDGSWIFLCSVNTAHLSGMDPEFSFAVEILHTSAGWTLGFPL